MTVVSSLGTELDLEIQQGADFAYALTILDTTQNPPVPRDISGFSFSAQLRKSWRSADVLATFSATPATDTATGVVTLALNSSDTGALLAGEDEDDPMSAYVWDVEMTDTDGKVTFPAYGTVAVRGRVTRP